MKLILSLLLLAGLSGLATAESNEEAKALQALLAGGSAEANSDLKDSELTKAMKKRLAPLDSEDHLLLVKVAEGDFRRAFLQASLNYKTGTPTERNQIEIFLPYLQYKAGLEITGVERLFGDQNVKSYPVALKKAWSDVDAAVDPLLPIIKASYRPGIDDLFGDGTATRLDYFQSGFIRSIPELKAKIEKSAPNSYERKAWMWQLQLNYGLNGQTDLAAKVLAQLMKVQNPPVSVDLMNITAGRLLFQNGFMPAAAEYYEKVPKSSDLWALAQEEKAWSYIRKGEPQNAFAATQSLIHPAMKGWVGPEAYFVRTLAQLKVCDYAGVIESLGMFRDRFKQRALELKNTSENGNTPAIEALVAQLKSGDRRWEKTGANSLRLPYSAISDEKLNFFAMAESRLAKESAAAEDLFALSLTSTGLQGEFEVQKNKIASRLGQVHQAAVGRVRQLAKQELDQIKKILDKLHIVEAEVVQQITVAQRLKKIEGIGSMKGATQTASAKDVLSFPNDGENWLDEIGSYKVDVKTGCQRKTAEK